MKIISFDNLKQHNFSLVLSGGGALGIAHLGVIEDLENSNITPKEIIGTSMGGIIGACLAIGLKPKEMLELFEEFSNVFNWVSFSFSGNSIITDEKIQEIFEEIFGTLKLKDSKIPLKIIATSLRDGDIKVFDKNDDIYIKDALLATMAIPGVFEEKIINDAVYVDGFLCENLGVIQSSYNYIIAIDVLGTNSFTKDTHLNHFFKTQNILEMFDKSMRLLIYNQTKTNLKNSNKNILLIEPSTKEYSTFQFHKYKEIKELGRGLLKTNIKI